MVSRSHRSTARCSAWQAQGLLKQVTITDIGTYRIGIRRDLHVGMLEESMSRGLP